VLLLPGLQKVVKDEEAKCKRMAHLEEERQKVEVALKVAEERRVAREEAVVALLEDSDSLSVEDFAIKLHDIECEFGLATVEEEKDDRMEVSQGEEVTGSGEFQRLQVKGDKSQPRPRPLTKVRAIVIDSVGSDGDEDNNSMVSEIMEVLPHSSKAGSKSSGGSKHKRSLGEVEVKTEQVRGGGGIRCIVHILDRSGDTDLPIPYSAIGARAW